MFEVTELFLEKAKTKKKYALMVLFLHGHFYHGHFTLEQLRISLVNKTHTKPYTGPRLKVETIDRRGLSSL